MQTNQHSTPSVANAHVQLAHRTTSLSHGHHVPRRVVWTPRPNPVLVESRLEAQVLGSLLLNPNLGAIYSQPFTLSVWDGQKCRRYTPDFLVVFERLTGTIVRMGFGYLTIVEAQPACRLLREEKRLAAYLQLINELLGLSSMFFTKNDLLAQGDMS